MLRKTTPSTIGLDISSTSIKLLELGRRGDRYSVESYAVMPIPSGVVVEKVIKDPSALADVIVKAREKAQAKSKHVAVALSDSSVITKVIQMEENLSEAEMEAQIMVEADKYIPYPIEEVNLDFSVLQPSTTHKNMVDVLLVACRSDNVDYRVAAIEQAGLIPRIVDVESYAIERAVELIVTQLPNQGRDQAIAIADIGSIMSSLTVLYNLGTVFTREEVFGGEQLTRAIQREFGLSYAEAGKAKKFGGLPANYESDVLMPFKESVVMQIRRALQFFFSASQHSEVKHILLAGGSVSLPGLPELIQEKIGITTRIANPFETMEFSSQVNKEMLMRDASALMICCGLAMRSFS